MCLLERTEPAASYILSCLPRKLALKWELSDQLSFYAVAICMVKQKDCCLRKKKTFLSITRPTDEVYNSIELSSNLINRGKDGGHCGDKRQFRNRAINHNVAALTARCFLFFEVMCRLLRGSHQRLQLCCRRNPLCARV